MFADLGHFSKRSIKVFVKFTSHSQKYIPLFQFARLNFLSSLFQKELLFAF